MPKVTSISTVGTGGGDPAERPALEGKVLYTGHEMDDLFGDLNDEDEFLNALFFGQEACGKTTAAAFALQLPGDGIVLFVNAESGLKPTALATFGLEYRKIKQWPDRKTYVGKIKFEDLDDLAYKLSGMLQRNPGCVKAVVFDSGTEVTNIIMEEITGEAFVKSQNDSRLAKRDNKHVTMVQDYGEMTTKARTLLRAFRDLPCHFIVTALEKEQDLGGEVKEWGPEMTPKLATALLGYVDVSIRFSAETLDVEGVEGVESKTLVEGLCQKTHKVRAKDRFGKLPKVLPNPTVDRVWAYIKGDLTTQTDPAYAEFTAARQSAEDYKESVKQARLNRNRK